MHQEWFELNAERRRVQQRSSWIPLRALVHRKTGQIGRDGYQEEFQGFASVAIPITHRDRGNEINWANFGIRHNQSSYAFPNGDYKPVDEYRIEDHEPLGVELVLVQSISGHSAVWTINQDLPFALKLLREGDDWLCPEQDYSCLIRLKRDKNGDPESIHIRTDALRDYLAARGMVLRINQYQSRVSIEHDASHIKWPGRQLDETAHGARFQARVHDVVEGGLRPGESTAVFHVARTDHMDEDVPELNPESDENTSSDHWTRRAADGPRLFRIQGEFWKDEWIEPADKSVLVRDDRELSRAFFVVDTAGSRMSADDLNDSDIGKWLWFDPRIVTDLLARRGGHLQWYTRETGAVRAGPIYDTHFGMNKVGLLNVYAHDVAILPEWQRRVWAARNVFPEGGLSNELMLSQVRAKPADTRAPERDLPLVMQWLDNIFLRRWERHLFQQRNDLSSLLARVHRFRAHDDHTLFELAKDVVRVTADLIDRGTLHFIAPPKNGEGSGSLKSLERVAAMECDEPHARAIFGPLHGLYNMRLADAHLPSSELDGSFALAQIDRTKPFYFQGYQLLRSTVRSLVQIAQILKGNADDLGKISDS